jgi:hypothetical protein
MHRLQEKERSKARKEERKVKERAREYPISVYWIEVR